MAFAALEAVGGAASETTAGPTQVDQYEGSLARKYGFTYCFLRQQIESSQI